MTLAPLVVESDSREKYPIPFPANIFVANRWTGFRKVTVPVKTVRKRLDYGDYRLQGAPTCCVIERKASKDELLTNLFDQHDRLRCGRAFKRLADNARHPYLLIEMSLHEFFKKNHGGGGSYQVTVDELLHRLYLSAALYGFNVLWVPRTADRKLLGVSLAHLMLAHALHDEAVTEKKQ